MADDQEKAGADLPADPNSVELDLAAMGLDDVELTEEEQVALAAAGARPTRKVAGEAASSKGHATPKRRRLTTEERKRTTPVQFVRESVAELKKVIWPTPNQLQQYFVVVLVFVLIMIAIVSLLDLGFGTLILRIFG